MDPSVALSALAIFTSACLGGLLLVAGLAKAVDLTAFADVLGAGGLVARSRAQRAGLAIVVAELFVGGALFLGLASAALSVVVSVMLAVFAIAQGTMVVRGRSGVPCGCFGVDPRRTVGIGSVAMSTALAALAAGAGWVLATGEALGPTGRFGGLASAWIVAIGVGVGWQVRIAVASGTPASGPRSELAEDSR